MTKSETEECYQECVDAAKKVLVEIKERLLSEEDTRKLKLLEHLNLLITKL